MVRKLKLLLFYGAIFSIVLLTGCVKKKCYHCYAWNEGGYCYKGTDTMGFSVSSMVAGADTLASYQSRGYTCHINYAVYLPLPYAGEPPQDMCDERMYNYDIAHGDTCIFQHN